MAMRERPILDDKLTTTLLRTISSPVASRVVAGPAATMVKKKSKSSRQTLKQKYKIQKRVQEHDRKLRKLAKKGGKAPGKKFKDPGIPNSWPLKKELLEQVALAKEKAERKKVEDREARAEARKLARAGGGSLAALAAVSYTHLTLPTKA